MFYPHFALHPQDEVCLRDVENTPKFTHLILSWPHDPILGLADRRPALIIMTKMTMMMAVVLLMVMVVVSLASQAPNFPRFRCLSRWSSAEASIPNLTWLKSQIGFVAMDGSQNNEKRIQQPGKQSDKEGEEKKALITGLVLGGSSSPTLASFLSHFFHSVQSQKCSITSTPFLWPLLCFEHLGVVDEEAKLSQFTFPPHLISLGGNLPG